MAQTTRTPGYASIRGLEKRLMAEDNGDYSGMLEKIEVGHGNITAMGARFPELGDERTYGQYYILNGERGRPDMLIPDSGFMLALLIRNALRDSYLVGLLYRASQKLPPDTPQAQLPIWGMLGEGRSAMYLDAGGYHDFGGTEFSGYKHFPWGATLEDTLPHAVKVVRANHALHRLLTDSPDFIPAQVRFNAGNMESLLKSSR
ncbi:hypothetical protein HYU15_03160 [Candidatus Woesearchaeota archaeon]|nr:hypothetical protein [Candidatus Woesearchaeota archaeon]